MRPSIPTLEDHSSGVQLTMMESDSESPKRIDSPPAAMNWVMAAGVPQSIL